MSIPELRRREYPEQMIIGTLAGRGHLGSDDPALADADRLWRDDQRKHHQTVLCGHRAGPRAGGMFMAYVAVITVEEYWNPQRNRDMTFARRSQFAVPDPGDVPDLGCDRVDVPRYRHRDRGRRIRCHRRAGAGGVCKARLTGDLYRKPDGRNADLGDDRADSGGGRVPELSMGFTGLPRVGRLIAALDLYAVRTADGSAGVLYHSGHVSGRDFVGRSDHGGGRAHGARGGDRPDLVRHLSSWLSSRWPRSPRPSGSTCSCCRA